MAASALPLGEALPAGAAGVPKGEGVAACGVAEGGALPQARTRA